MPPAVVTSPNNSIVPDASLATDVAVTALPSRVMPKPLRARAPSFLVPPSTPESRISCPADSVRFRATFVLLSIVLAKLIVCAPDTVATTLPVNSTAEAKEISSVVRRSPLSLFVPAPFCVTLALRMSPSAAVVKSASLTIITSPVAVTPALRVSALPVNLK